MSKHFFPPTVEEWHGFAIGFSGGFVYGATPTKWRGVVIGAILAAFVVLTIVAPHGGHVWQAAKEFAYTAFGFVVGMVVGKWWRLKGKPGKPNRFRPGQAT